MDPMHAYSCSALICLKLALEVSLEATFLNCPQGCTPVLTEAYELSLGASVALMTITLAPAMLHYSENPMCASAHEILHPF